EHRGLAFLLLDALDLRRIHPGRHRDRRHSTRGRRRRRGRGSRGRAGPGGRGGRWRRRWWRWWSRLVERLGRHRAPPACERQPGAAVEAPLSVLGEGVVPFFAVPKPVAVLRPTGPRHAHRGGTI